MLRKIEKCPICNKEIKSIGFIIKLNKKNNY